MKNPFEKVKLTQLHTLCNTIAEADVRHLNNIKRKYLKSAIAFEETISLLKALNIIKTKSDLLILTKAFSFPIDSIQEFKIKFTPFLFSANRFVSKYLNTFLLNFQIDIDNINFRATVFDKIKFSAVRNLLLELEFITVSEDNTTYFINPIYTELFMSQFSRRRLSPEKFKKNQINNESIALKAEISIIEFESSRLTNISLLPHEIEHTSLKNVLAGYDIKSYENYLDINFNRIERYIEVKAVSIEDYNFYWSRNEIQIAKVFGEKYYLYLLPVISKNLFDFDNLIIKQNPYKNIYPNEAEWRKDEEIVSFSKIQTNKK